MISQWQQLYSPYNFFEKYFRSVFLLTQMSEGENILVLHFWLIRQAGRMTTKFTTILHVLNDFLSPRANGRALNSITAHVY